MNKNLLDLSILELSERLKAKSISSVELVTESYRRMEASEAIIHAAITIREKADALTMAKKLMIHERLIATHFMAFRM